MKVMEGREDDQDRSYLVQIVGELRHRQVDGIIPGCTELPLLLKDRMNDAGMVNPAQLLAEAAVKYALK